MATTYLERTLGTPTNNLKCTLSMWVKRLDIGSTHDLFTCGSDNNNEFLLRLDNDDTLLCKMDSGGTEEMSRRTNRKFRDTNAWLHIVVSIDTTLSTASDRQKIYINGVQETSFSSTVNFGLNNGLYINSAIAHRIGSRSYEANNQFNGLMSHIHFIDGTAYDASYFGETDNTTGEWKIKTSPSVTYGNNGFWILKDGNSVTDQSGNSNNWTVSAGTLTNTEDCPSNVFCTANRLSKMSSVALTNGNTTVRKDTSGNSHSLGTIAFGNGKYYFEGYRHGGGNDGIGVCLASADGTTDNSVASSRVLYYEDGQIMCDALSDQSNINTGVSYADTDIISVSFDTENGILKFYKNDTLVTNSTITNSSFEFANNLWVPHTYQSNGGEWRLNFGNGYFGTTAVSSAGTNASGNGIFEYDVKPSDATAVSTKGLNL